MRSSFPGTRLMAVIMLALLACAGAAGPAGADVPPVLSYDGYLTDADGRPLATGRRDITFSLYLEPADGTPLWSETHEKVLISGGVFHVILGRGTVPRPLELSFDRTYFLGVQVGTDPELSPRQELLPGAYSFHANMASAVVDSSIGTSKLQAQSVTDEKIKSVSWSKITGVNGVDHGVPAQVWSLKGNRIGAGTGPFLGTVDDAPLLFRTNNLPRLDIAADGNIEAHAQFLARGPIISRMSESGAGVFYLGDNTAGLIRTVDDVSLISEPGFHVDGEGGSRVTLYSPDGSLTLGDGELTVEADLKVDGDGRFAGLDVEDYRPGGYVAEFKNSSNLPNGHGVKITAGDNTSGLETRYVSFYSPNGTGRGRITGQTRSEVDGDSEWIKGAAALLAKEIINGAYSWKDWGQGLATWAVDFGLYMWNWHTAIDNAGVTYASGSADYAEWLPRLNPDEALAPGQVVGVFGGRVTRVTRGAERVMVVSTNPIVLGNMPDEGEEHLYTKVAFLGQVPVQVRGTVECGDFLIPSGRGDGIAIAVAPSLMTAKEFALALGRAWQSSSDPARKLVNAAVGLNSGDLAPLLERTEAQVAGMRAQLQARTASLAALEGRMAEMEARVASMAAAGKGSSPPARAQGDAAVPARAAPDMPAGAAGSAVSASDRAVTSHDHQ